LDLATLKANLLVLKRRYTRIIGTLYAELDDLEAQIAEAKANLDPKNKETQFKAEETRRRAQESQEASTSAIIEKEQEKFRPSDELKKLYRQAAKAMHPDLTINEKSHAICLQMMAEVNLTYEEGSEEKLHEILRRWETSPDSVEGEGVGAELIRVIRKIS
jgi:seryl-tRNA synthetase